MLRLLGLQDAGPRGVPLVNTAVDALHQRRLLGRGAAYWMGYALRRGATGPASVVERIASLPAQPPPLDREEELSTALDRVMRDASAVILRGYELPTDVQIVRPGGHFFDERGAEMWGTVARPAAKPEERRA